MIVIIRAIAELERNLIIERVRAGMRRAKLGTSAYFFSRHDYTKTDAVRTVRTRTISD
jgi:DNA invertase Pin-like site-specific DNA recombinase